MLRNQRGLTAIELLLAVSLTAVVLLLAAAFFDTTRSVFVEGRQRAQVQHELRWAADLITNEIRNATALTLTTGGPDTNDTWIYTNASGCLAIRSGMDIREMTHSGFIQSMNFTTSQSSTGKYMLNVDLTGTDGFTVTTDILLNNMDTANPPSGSSGTKLRYVIP